MYAPQKAADWRNSLHRKELTVGCSTMKYMKSGHTTNIATGMPIAICAEEED